MTREAELLEQLRRLTEIGIALSSERSLDALLERILQEARRFARAEAGTLYVREGDVLRFAMVQNERISALDIPSGGGHGLAISMDSIAGYVASTAQTLNLPDVYRLPDGVPYKFDDSFDRRSGYRTVSTLAVPMREASGEVNGVIQLINAIDPATGRARPFDSDIEPMSLALASHAGVALHNAQLTAELESAYEETIVRLAIVAEYRDGDTGQHIRRVAHYTEVLGLAMGLSAEDAKKLLLASPMHDVGKVKIPDAILKKPGALTGDERREIEQHTLYGGDIFDGSEVPLLQLAGEIAMTHHERWDGAGYPRGLAQDEIPLSGRITAVVDVFDALTSARCYKEPMSVDEACEFIRERAGSHFDPAVVGTFLEILPDILGIRSQFQDG